MSKFPERYRMTYKGKRRHIRAGQNGYTVHCNVLAILSVSGSAAEVSMFRLLGTVSVKA